MIGIGQVDNLFLWWFSDKSTLLHWIQFYEDYIAGKAVSLLTMKFCAAVLTQGNPCLCCTWVGCKIILTILAAPITVQCWVAWWYGLGAPLHRLCYWHDYYSSILCPSDLSRSCRHTQGCETIFCRDLLALLCLGQFSYWEITQILQMSSVSDSLDFS